MYSMGNLAPAPGSFLVGIDAHEATSKKGNILKRLQACLAEPGERLGAGSDHYEAGKFLENFKNVTALF